MIQLQEVFHTVKHGPWSGLDYSFRHYIKILTGVIFIELNSVTNGILQSIVSRKKQILFL